MKDNNHDYEIAVLIGFIALIMVLVALVNTFNNIYMLPILMTAFIFSNLVIFSIKNPTYNKIMNAFAISLGIMMLALGTYFLLYYMIFDRVILLLDGVGNYQNIVNKVKFPLLKNNYFNFIIGLTISAFYQIYLAANRSSYESVLNKELMSFFRKEKKSGILLGTDTNSKKKVLLEDLNLDHHTQIIGASGSGKTNILKNILEDRVKSGQGIVFLDFKGETSMVDWMKLCLEKYERSNDFHLFSITDSKNSISYNPIETGSATEITSRIMESFNWSEEFYKKYSQRALNLTCEFLIKAQNITKININLTDIYFLLSDEDNFKKINDKLHIISEDEMEYFCKTLYSKEAQKNLSGLISDIENIAKLDIGSNLSSDFNSNIMNKIKGKKVIFFQMNSMINAAAAKAIGKLFLNDIIYLVGKEFLKEDPMINCCLIVDEFAEFATPNFVNLINRSRGAKLPIIIAHQSSGDLKRISDDFSNSIETNTGNKIIFGTALHDEAEKFAKYVGTKRSIKETETFKRIGSIASHKDIGRTGSIREVEEFIVHPNEIKRMKRGHALVIKRLVNEYAGIVKIPLASKYK